jgi:hypothetical protein
MKRMIPQKENVLDREAPGLRIFQPEEDRVALSSSNLQQRPAHRLWGLACLLMRGQELQNNEGV